MDPVVRPPQPEGLTKIRIPLAPAAGSMDTELVWAEGLEPDVYQVWNVPFLAYNVNIADVVRCSVGEDGVPEVQAILRRSGSQTLRLYFAPDVADAEIERLLALVTESAGVVEKGERTFWAVGLRSLTSLERFAAGLADAQARGALRLDDGYQPALPLFEPDARITT
jgi:hypothetical protein